MKRVRVDAQVRVVPPETVVSNQLPVDIKEEEQGEDVIAYDALSNILCDFKVKEFMHSKTSLLITQEMKALYEELEAANKHKQGHTNFLQGPTGVGKTSTLLYIGHMARRKGYIVFPVQAHNFVKQARPLSMLIKEFLRNWIAAVGENILKDIFPNLSEYIKRIICTPSLNHNSFGDGKSIVEAFALIVEELKRYRKKPVVFLIDQYNAFHEKKQGMRMYSDSVLEIDGPKKNPVGAMFLDWDTFHVHRGGIFYGFSSAFQSMPDAPDGHGALFSRMEPMNREKFKVFVDFLVKQNRLSRECDCDDFFDLCGGIPREALQFGTGMGGGNSDYWELKEEYLSVRIPHYKKRIQRLLDKQKVGYGLLHESVSFASSLFVGQEMVSAPDVWIASGLTVSKDGFEKLLCPAAKEAIQMLFEESKVIREAINVLHDDRTTRWRGFELAGVHRFRCSYGRPIDVDYTDLCGDKERTLRITASLIEHGGTRLPMANSIPRSTVFVCLRNIPVVEFFIHDADGAQILIQVSGKSYRDHKPKYNPEDHNIQVYAAAASNPSPRAKLQYIYMTTNYKLMKNDDKKSKHYREDVKLVADNDMKRFLGGLVDNYSSLA